MCGGRKDTIRDRIARVRECVCVWEEEREDTIMNRIARVRECVCVCVCVGGGERRYY